VERRAYGGGALIDVRTKNNQDGSSNGYNHASIFIESFMPVVPRTDRFGLWLC